MRAACIATLATMGLATDIDTLYAKYVAQYRKNYLTTEEYEMRMSLFAEKHFIISEHNMGDGHVLAHNTFSDWTEAELKTLTGYLPSEETVEPETEEVAAEFVGVGHLDWRNQLRSMRVIKNQGQCGSCWAFSTIGSIESRSEHAGHGYISLSEQQLVDCVPGSNCGGGVYQNAMRYAQQHGNCAENDYGYTARNGWCADRNHRIVSRHVRGQRAVGRSPSALRNAITHGPVSVAIQADQPVFQHYRSGVISVNSCGTSLDHAVLAIGFGNENGRDYILIRNSWGPNWGDHGTVKLGTNNNQCACGCERDPLAVLV